tara:strand:- start:2317 stop:3084 length:768 start_codon:yes stop_codon:yes gene_type:complete
MKSEITIIIVTLNSDRYLETTIKSVLNQELYIKNKVNILIQDGGSKDKTLSICRKFQKNFKNISIVQEKDHSHFDAMNKASDKVKTKYLLYLHSDDYFNSPKSLNYLYYGIKNKNWCCAFVDFINSKNSIFKVMKPYKFTYKDMLVSNRVCHQTVLIKSFIHKNIKFDTRFSYAGDYLFFLNVWKKYGDPQIILKNIVNQRFDGKNISSNYYLSLVDEFMCRLHFIQKKNKKHSLKWLIIFILRYLKLYFFYNKK